MINRYKPHIKKSTRHLFECRAFVFRNFPFLIVAFGETPKEAFDSFQKRKFFMTEKENSNG